MSVTGRQNNLFLAEDWRRIYQTFKYADFTSYDFENIRRVMISYLRENYPENFNDYIESSEYLALIDLIAFLGQSLAFRMDLNARENFLELAERRESILRLARLLSYNVKRNICASGLLKFESVSTTEEVIDAGGRNLQNIIVTWNDNTNNNWFDQFVKIMNSAMISNLQFGIPQTYSLVNGIYTEQYRLNSQINDLTIFPYSKVIDGRSYNFEVTSTITKDSTIQEEAPYFGRRVSLLYRDDQSGYGSNDTGWFMHFRQGSLQQRDFSLITPTTNQIVDVTEVNINNDDVWLYALDQNNKESALWTQIPSITGNNVIYNSIDKTIRNIYSVQTGTNDSISLVFGDGIFGNLPKGNFRCYYRTSNGISYSIHPRDMRGIVVSIPYVSKAGSVETLQVTMSLTSSVTNASAAESNQEVKNRAPATYYTQNRMVTGEDYNLAPLSSSQSIAKVKAVNRTTSGISKNFDLIDPTGKYSTTSSFCTDGMIYREDIKNNFDFTFNSRTDIESMIKNKVEPITKLPIMRDFYYGRYKFDSIDITATLNQSTSSYNETTGYILGIDGVTPTKVGVYAGSNILKYIEPGALVKFSPPAGKYFSASGTLVSTASTTTTDRIWSRVSQVTGDGTGYNSQGNLITGIGPLVFDQIIPTGSIITRIIPKFLGYMPTTIQSLMIDLIFNYKNFGLRFDYQTRNWAIVQAKDLNVSDPWDQSTAGNTNSLKLDTSWIISFETNGQKYIITYRGLEYYFESIKENRFFFDGTRKIYDPTTGKLQKDKVSVLKFNTFPSNNNNLGRDYPWEIIGTTSESDGYTSSKAVKITFADSNDDGVVDNPEEFDIIVNPTITNSNFPFIFFEKYVTDNYNIDYRHVSNDDNMFLIYDKESSVLFDDRTPFNNGQLFYFYYTDIVKIYNKTSGTFTTTRDYYANVGRSGLYFHYLHNADSTVRIDPSASNIMDLYLLIKDYDTEYRKYINGDITTQPLPPSSTELRLTYGGNLDKIKSISDDIIYHPVRYKPLFGDSADKRLQATFKVVRNMEQVITDNDIKTRIIAVINRFFAIDNWDFGDTFYFSELSASVMNNLVPYITTFLIVPNNSDQVYGSLQQISSAPNEIFISSATVNNIEIIESITADNVKSAGYILTTSILDINSNNLTSSTNF